MATILAIAGTELGWGKRGLMAHLAAFFAHRHDMRVLGVDVTSQNLLLRSFGLHDYTGPYFFERAADIAAARSPLPLLALTPDLHLLPAVNPAGRHALAYDPDLDPAWEAFGQVLRAHADNYDLVLLDTPPTNKDYTSRAYELADLVLIPSGLDFEEAWHVAGLLDNLEDMRNETGRQEMGWRIILHEGAFPPAQLPTPFHTSHVPLLLRTQLFPPPREEKFATVPLFPTCMSSPALRRYAELSDELAKLMLGADSFWVAPH